MTRKAARLMFPAGFAVIIIERFCMSAAQWLRIHVAQFALDGPSSVPSELPNICTRPCQLRMLCVEQRLQLDAGQLLTCQLYPPAVASFSTAFCHVFCVAIWRALVCFSVYPIRRIACPCSCGSPPTSCSPHNY